MLMSLFWIQDALRTLVALKLLTLLRECKTMVRERERGREIKLSLDIIVLLDFTNFIIISNLNSLKVHYMLKI